MSVNGLVWIKIKSIKCVLVWCRIFLVALRSQTAKKAATPTDVKLSSNGFNQLLTMCQELLQLVRRLK